MKKLNTVLEFDGVLDNYYVDTDGHLYYLCENDMLYKKKVHISRNGYCYVSITYKKGGSKKHYLHRVIAMSFIPNPENKPQVNHIDENKQNNAVDNLEWVTPKENMNHGTVMDKIKNSKKNKTHIEKKVKFVKCESKELYNVWSKMTYDELNDFIHNNELPYRIHNNRKDRVFNIPFNLNEVQLNNEIDKLIFLMSIHWFNNNSKGYNIITISDMRKYFNLSQDIPLKRLAEEIHGVYELIKIEYTRPFFKVSASNSAGV